MTDVNKNRRLKPRRRASPGAGLRSGITRRWARGSLLVIVLLLAVIEGMFLYSTIQGYYDGVQQSMYRRFSSINGQLKVYSSGTVQRTAASRSFALRRMVEQFSDKDKYEFMLLDGSGNVIASTSGTNAGGIIVPDDFEQAQTAADGYGTAVYTTSTGEPVMSVCCLVPYAAEEIVAMRLVTSLALIRQQIRSAVLLGLVAGGGGPGHRGGLRAVLRAQHRGAPGPGGARRRRHCPGRPGHPPARGRPAPGRAGPAAGQHQPDGPGPGRDRKDEKRVHLLGVPRAAHPSDLHPGLGGDPGSPGRPGGPKLPQGAGDHPQRDGAAVQHGGRAAGLQPAAERGHPHGMPPPGPGGRADRRPAVL